ncbi:BUD22-domain-containing protein [Mortierella sp. GBAus27b]|nr:BUD22-domain-containing protein [Mortierella sp. GBAus27b]
MSEPMDIDSTGGAMSKAGTQLLKLKEQKISQKIFHVKKELKKTFVKASGFETQKLIKRIKTARTTTKDTEDETNPTPSRKPNFTQEDVARLEQELELLKTMDMEALSQHVFVTKLSKHPTLKKHELLAPYREESMDKTNSGNTSDKDAILIQSIQSRLIGAKAIKVYLEKLWSELEHIVLGKKADSGKRRRAGDDQEDQEDQERKKTKTAQDTIMLGDSQDESDGGDDQDGSEEERQWDVSDEEEDDGYDTDGLPIPKAPKNKKASMASSMFVGSLNEDHSQKNKKDRNKKRDKNDWVDEKFDEIYGKAKKNRPGQQERRKQAEVKYGKEANHIKKAEEEARLREEKKAARKAKKEQSKSAHAQGPLGKQRKMGAGESAGQATPSPSQPPVDPTLHPSWVAKQSEKLAISAALTAGKSNKIVFDDSD